ncbi:hypothetical protein TR2A62_2692 [Thalassobium sp. R2A62]|nr:hypothetical protein TR2A62_2692 [Thalassobium sp. R2A62]
MSPGVVTGMGVILTSAAIFESLRHLFEMPPNDRVKTLILC